VPRSQSAADAASGAAIVRATPAMVLKSSDFKVMIFLPVGISFLPR
jgi:hypothetical protein